MGRECHSRPFFLATQPETPYLLTMKTMKTITLAKVCLIALAVSTLTLISSSANAQTPSAPRLAPKIYVGGGVASISNPDFLKETFDPSLSFLLGVGLPLSPGFEIMAKLHHHKYGLADGLQLTGTAEPGFSITTIGADIKWPFAPPLAPARPFILLGAGSFSLTNDQFNYTDGIVNFGFVKRSESSFYFNAGVGVDVSLGPTLAFFVEAKYTILNTRVESTGIFPIVAGIRIL